MIYAGIGSRQTPQHILSMMTKVAMSLANQGYILRSGAADGADKAFEHGAFACNGKSEIFLPWKGFNNSLSQLYSITPAALTMAMKYHPAWNRLSGAGQKLMARNCYQVLGSNLKTPCDFVICWTRDGYNKGMIRTQDSGGTGQAIDIALAHDIPVYNMNSFDGLEIVKSMLP